ncbi:dolichyl pyrophosphate Man9GlcNAc2 alpha-1,3-glucosyltransferase-like protein [Elsinoe australis]|uniref:Alpha-1,3-glucosyltransferase n=1 Tax=Elsinoe australis TaxID=40998 RepID=A0A4U7B7C8_9PEZI|nr:dolichyl pyrophosphate Man9GlcNAc2 alpha-1,3-glucosyltransferase-like protein [Elsinoe australis]
MAQTPSKARHTPRKKRPSSAPLLVSDNGALLQVGSSQQPAFPLAAFLLPAKGSVSQWVSVPLLLMAVGLFRWALGFWGYSGMAKPPMHGDFEAQRHWMELTINLPISHWYFYDLQWWGLDYPPLTAYHSWVLGKIGNYIDKSWFALYTSRGLDDQYLKVFMRATVIISEYITFIPGAIVCIRRLSRLSGVGSWEASIALTALLMQPATLLIDHGHFQYNTVMLGFLTSTVAGMLRGHPARSCMYFVAALGFKQMALFYAPAVFAYLLGICIFPRINIVRFLAIAISTLASFAVLYLPFLLGVAYDAKRRVPLPSDYELPPLLATLPFEIPRRSFFYPLVLQLAQSIHRIFPFARGLFEDKVANIWCAIHSSGLHKLTQYDSSLLSRAALLVTLAAITPPCFILFIKPKRILIPWAFAGCAWGFFLCSYQVHEKNVLLPLLPMTVLLASEKGLKPDVRAWVGFANVLATWTCFPLLKRDELRVPYFVLTLLWAWLLGLPPTSLSLYVGKQGASLNILTKLVHLSFYFGMIAWHVGEAFVPPPERMPDLWVVGNAVAGAAGFGLCYLWCVWNQIARSGLFTAPSKDTSTIKKLQ